MSRPDTEIVANLLREGFARGQLAFLTVTSASMSPLLRAGDRVGVQQINLEALRKGDIVVIHQDTSLLTHRFHGLLQTAECDHALPGRRNNKSQSCFVTRGDRVVDFDPLWQERQLLGRVVSRQRARQTLWLDYGWGRWLNQWLGRLAQIEQRTIGAKNSRRPIKRRLSQRLLRAGFRAIAVTLTKTVEHII